MIDVGSQWIQEYYTVSAKANTEMAEVIANCMGTSSTQAEAVSLELGGSTNEVASAGMMNEAKALFTELQCFAKARHIPVKEITYGQDAVVVGGVEPPKGPTPAL